MEKKINIFNLIDSLKLSTQEQLELAKHLMVSLAMDTDKKEYMDIYDNIHLEIKKLIKK